MVKTLVTAAALIVSSAGATLAQDVEKGATLFKQCAVCHKIGPGATNGVGPELNGLDGRHSGSVANYSYSDANKNSGIVWNEETFKEYIKDPKAKIPGTKMIFAGIKNEQQAKDLWAYLKQFDAQGNIKMLRATLRSKLAASFNSQGIMHQATSHSDKQQRMHRRLNVAAVARLVHLGFDICERVTRHLFACKAALGRRPAQRKLRCGRKPRGFAVAPGTGYPAQGRIRSPGSRASGQHS